MMGGRTTYHANLATWVQSPETPPKRPDTVAHIYKPRILRGDREEKGELAGVLQTRQPRVYSRNKVEIRKTLP